MTTVETFTHPRRSAYDTRPYAGANYRQFEPIMVNFPEISADV